MALRAPRAPFGHWKVHAFTPVYGHCWFHRGLTALITQTVVKHASVEGALQLCDWIDTALEHESAAIVAAGGLMLVHDWRSLAGYDSQARVLINERMRRRPRRYARRTVCVVEPTPLWRMALTVTDLTYALLGVPPATMTVDIQRVGAELAGQTPGAPPPWLVEPAIAP